MKVKTFLALFLASPWAFAANICPPLGPVFPEPVNLNKDDSFKSKLSAELNAVLNNAYNGGNTSYGLINSTVPSAFQIFSADESSPLYEYYHDGGISNSSWGVKHVDGNSIFPIGSITKLLGVYTLLIEIGDQYWDRKITDFIPELQQQAADGEKDHVKYVAWDTITLGALAGQIAGVTREVTEMDPALRVDNATSFGLPPLNPEDIPACIENTTYCDRAKFFQALPSRRPVFAPYTTPGYSNTGFMLLGYALESIVGQPLSSLMQRSLINPLNLTGTTYAMPNTSSKRVVLVDPFYSGWVNNVSDLLMAGGVFSTPNDLSTIGRSILQSSLIDPNTTRAWLKPVSHTSSLTAAVGRPWEITRYTKTIQNRVIDIYAKSGDVGIYHTAFALIPEYNVGFLVLLADGEKDRSILTAFVLDALIPALEDAARRQTENKYAGSFSALNGLNSSIAFATKDSSPGLLLTNWISNNTDLLSYFQTHLAGIIGYNFGAETRLYPTGLIEDYGNGTQKESWRLGADSWAPITQDVGLLPGCFSWFEPDALTYGNLAVDNFVFTVEHGKVVSVAPEVMKLEMSRDS